MMYHVDQSIKLCAQIYLQKMECCINLQLYQYCFFVKSIISDMHHHKTYMYINFQQNRVNRSVITVYTKLFAKNRKLHKVATTNSIFFLNHSFRHASCKTYMYINFQQNRVSRSVKKNTKSRAH